MSLVAMILRPLPRGRAIMLNGISSSDLASDLLNWFRYAETSLWLAPLFVNLPLELIVTRADGGRPVPPLLVILELWVSIVRILFRRFRGSRKIAGSSAIT